MKNDYLVHHGILGQKWGVMHGPPYPLDYESHSKAQKDQNPKSVIGNYSVKRVKSSNHTDSSSARKPSEKKLETKNADKRVGNPQDITSSSELENIKLSASEKKWFDNFGVDEQTKEKLIKAAKVTGIVVGTAAGAYAMAYLIQNRKQLSLMITSPQEYFQILDVGYNADGTFKPYSVADINNQSQGNFVGIAALNHGFISTNADQISYAIANKSTDEIGDLNHVIQNMRINQLDGSVFFAGGSGSRRLSCWSGSNAYFMSLMTGHEFASKSYENLVDFNDFGKLYTNKPSVFNLSGENATDFVGRFGRHSARATESDAIKLLQSIGDRISAENNISADGSRSVGFINAAYHSTTCTHQWNFEVEYLPGDRGNRSIYMADSYTGDRSLVGAIIGGELKTSMYFDDFVNELGHYNADSIRFYAPNVTDVNPETISTVILENKRSMIHSAISFVCSPWDYRGNGFGSDYLAHYGILGMKWGVRRYQNFDGSLTEAGKKRHFKIEKSKKKLL